LLRDGALHSGHVCRERIGLGGDDLAGFSALWGLTQDPAISNGAGAVAVIEFCALLCWPTAKGYERHYVIASFAWQWANGQ